MFTSLAEAASRALMDPAVVVADCLFRSRQAWFVLRFFAKQTGNLEALRGDAWRCRLT